MRGIKKKLAKHVSTLKLLVFVGIFATIGIVCILLTKAAVSTASIEPEGGSKTGVQVVASAGTSNNAYVQFKQVSTSTSCKIAIPAYFYPTVGSHWNNAINAQPAPEIMIMDVTTQGAGLAVDSNWLTAVNNAKAKGVQIFGYVDTNYTARTRTGFITITGSTNETNVSIEQEVANYKQWYGITDIFLDQVSSDTAGTSYYQSVVNMIHASNQGSRVILNNGTIPNEPYMNIGDILATFESSYQDYQNYQAPSWQNNYPASKYWHIIYGVPSNQIANVITLAKNRHAGYVYATDDVLPNPYDTLPTYWNTEVSTVANTCGS